MNKKFLTKIGCALLAGALLFGSAATINVAPRTVFATETGAGTPDPNASTDTEAQTKADAAIAAITAIGTVDENSGAAIDAAQAAYDACPDKSLVSNAADLTAAKEAYASIQTQKQAKDAEKQQLLTEATNAVNALGTITESSGSAISDARAKYDKAAAAGCDVSGLTTQLTNAETAYKEIVAAADQAAQDEEAALTKFLDAVAVFNGTEINESSREAVTNARNIYNSLSDSAKEKARSTSAYTALTIAEDTLSKLSEVVSEENDDTDISYAKEGNVTLMGTDASYVFIGDSRTVGMAQYVNTNQHIWSAKVGAGLSWMKSEGVPAVENKIESGSNVVILMGVNDCGNTSNEKKYATYINEKAKTWAAKGANVYYVSVNPITRDSVANGSITNAKIEAWNTAIQADLSDDVTYIDTYNKLKGELVATDGLHYTKRGCQLIYNAILEFVEADTVEEVDEDEAKKIEEFQTKITSTTRDMENNTVTLTVTAPANITNVSYQIALYNEETSSWDIATDTKMTTTTIEVPEGDVKIRARVQKKYDTETAQGKWSNIVTVTAQGEVTGVEEEGLGIVGKIIIGLVVAVVVFFGGYFILRKKGIIGPTPIDNVFNGIANLLEKIQQKFKKKEK